DLAGGVAVTPPVFLLGHGACRSRCFDSRGNDCEDDAMTGIGKAIGEWLSRKASEWLGGSNALECGALDVSARYVEDEAGRRVELTLAPGLPGNLRAVLHVLN